MCFNSSYIYTSYPRASCCRSFPNVSLLCPADRHFFFFYVTLLILFSSFSMRALNTDPAVACAWHLHNKLLREDRFLSCCEVPTVHFIVYTRRLSMAAQRKTHCIAYTPRTAPCTVLCTVPCTLPCAVPCTIHTVFYTVYCTVNRSVY